MYNIEGESSYACNINMIAIILYAFIKVITYFQLFIEHLACTKMYNGGKK